MFDLDKVLLSASKYNPEIFAQGQQEWTEPGTYSFIVPNYVTSISAVAIGGGGGGSYKNDGAGGGGGSLQWRNEISVTPGEILTVTVGAGGRPGSSSGSSGGESKIARGGTILVRALGGSGASSSTGGIGGQKVTVPGLVIGTLGGKSSHYNFTRNQSYTFIKKNGTIITPNLGRGHTLAVFNEQTLNIESLITYDTYGRGSDPLLRALQAVQDGKIIVIVSFDATAFYSSARNYLNANFGTTRTNTWSSSRVAHIVIAQKNTSGVTPYEDIHSAASDMTEAPARTQYGPIDSYNGGAGGNGGSGSERFGGNYLCGGGGGAGGYTGNGGNAGTATNSSRSTSYRNGSGGAGAGGREDDNIGRGGGGTGLHGQKNDGRGDGGGGSSYSLAGIAIDTTSPNSNKRLFPVSLSYAWSGFMNSYAVWTSNYGNTSGSIESVDRVIYAPYSGYYTLQQQADNLIIFKIDGSEIARTSDFRSSSPQSTQFYMTSGRHVITMDVQNYGGGSWGGNPAGFAALIRNTSSTIIWDTRTYANGNSSNINSTVRAGGTNADGMNGGDFGGGGSGRDGGSIAGYGGRGGVRIIWGPRRSYPYSAEDVIPFSAPPSGGLIVHYDFNNANSYVSGSSVSDISGNGNTGTINRSLSSASTFIGANEVFKYLPFPGNFNQKIDFSADELTSNIITVDMWAQISSFSGGMFFGWNIHDVWTSGGTLGFNTGQSDVFGISAARINSLSLVGKWVHYAFVMNAGDYRINKIYINGVNENLSQQYSSQYTPYTNFNSGNGRIGGWRLDNNYQQVMDLAIFRIWNRGLSQEEITSLYDDDKNRFTVNYQNGLWGRRVGGYYSDNVNYWNGRSISESRSVSQLAGFSSGSDQYSWQFKGYFIAPSSGTYYFRLYSDDASHLWLGSNAISGYSTSNAFINHGGLHGPSYSGINSIYLDAGSITPVRIMFGENYGQDVLSVLITGPGISGTSYGSGLFFHDESSKSN